MSKITEKMKEKLAMGHGISDSDVAELVSKSPAPAAPPATPEKAPEAVMGEKSVVAAEKPETHDAAARLASAEKIDEDFFMGIADAALGSSSVDITPADKEQFIGSVLSNTRMKSSYSLFGGRLRFTVKNRTYEEARAAMSIASSRAGPGELRQVFSLRLRLMLMALQIDEMNGVSYPDADTLGPLVPTYVGGKLVDPAWLDRLSVFNKLPEAVFEAIWRCIYEFESKYWTMIRHAKDQDFWRPE